MSGSQPVLTQFSGWASTFCTGYQVAVRPVSAAGQSMAGSTSDGGSERHGIAPAVVRTQDAKEADIVTSMNVLVILGAEQAPAGRCAVCGSYVRDGDGFVSSFRGRRIRLTGDGCLTRFTADPERYLASDALSVSPESPEAGPTSEWALFE